LYAVTAYNTPTTSNYGTFFNKQPTEIGLHKSASVHEF
jgi:hypothetical protein